MSQQFLLNYAQAISELNRHWEPHSGQVPIGQAMFMYGYESLFVQCGRKFGKTEIGIYLAWLIAKVFPGSPIYYVAPFSVQAREIVWRPGRMQHFGPREWLQSDPNNTDMSLTFKNGSFIKCDGSENYERHRGTFYKFCIYEEFKDHRPEFYRAMRPNASVLQGIDLFIGSPPDRDCDYVDVMKEHKEQKDKFHLHAPTWTNPHISREWLRREKEQLYRKGDGDVWEREYAAIYVKGGASKVFPMLNENMVVDDGVMRAQIRRERKDIEWLYVTDPGVASVFGGIAVAYNRHTKKIRVVREIYESDQKLITVKQIGRRIISQMEELHDDRDDFFCVYDEAETWFASEMLDHFGIHFAPTRKSANKKERGISLLKDIMLGGLIEFSNACPFIFKELDNYFKDKNGNIPKVGDHLIDCLRYTLASLNYEMNEGQKWEEEEKDDLPRRHTIERDLEDLGVDWEDKWS